MIGEYESALTVNNRNRHTHIVENGLKQCLRLEPQEGWHSGDPGFTGAVTYSGSRRRPQSTTPKARLTVASSVLIEQPGFPKMAIARVSVFLTLQLTSVVTFAFPRAAVSRSH